MAVAQRCGETINGPVRIPAARQAPHRPRSCPPRGRSARLAPRHILATRPPDWYSRKEFLKVSSLDFLPPSFEKRFHKGVRPPRITESDPFVKPFPSLWVPPMNEVTRILSAIDQGDAHAAEQLLPLVYDELRKLAAQRLAQEKSGQTL